MPYCRKIGLMLLSEGVIKSNCGCGNGSGCGGSSQVDCVVVIVDQFSFCSSLVRAMLNVQRKCLTDLRRVKCVSNNFQSWDAIIHSKIRF